MLPVIFHAEADEELKAGANYYESRVEGLGAAFLAAVAEAVQYLQSHPLSGSTVIDDIRRLVLRRFPYTLVYRVEEDRILVYAVAHTSREPEYWRGRTRWVRAARIKLELRSRDGSPEIDRLLIV